MLEPSIVDYYNELPQGVHVIEKLNKEYDELDNKYEDLKNKYDKLINEKNKILKDYPHVYHKMVIDKNINLQEFNRIERNNLRNIKRIIYDTLAYNNFAMITDYLIDNLEDELPKYLTYLTKNDSKFWQLHYKIIEDLCKFPFEIENNLDDNFNSPIQVALKLFNELDRNELTSILINEYEKSLEKIKIKYCMCECHLCNEEKEWHTSWENFDKFTCFECLEELGEL